MKAASIIIVAVSFFLGLALGTAEAQMNLAKVLPGKWQGEYQREPKEKFDNARTLVIGQLREESGKWIVEDAKFGVTGKKLYPIDVKLDAIGDEVKIEFTTDGGGLVKLKLSGENLLTGTFVRAAMFRPTKFQKVE